MTEPERISKVGSADDLQVRKQRIFKILHHAGFAPTQRKGVGRGKQNLVAASRARQPLTEPGLISDTGRRSCIRPGQATSWRSKVRTAVKPTVVDRDSAPDGVAFRRSLRGPELELVERFIPAMPVVHAPDSRVTVLREPGLESGFPDLVIVVWRDTRTADWNESRLALIPDDLRLMHYIFQRRRAAQSEIEQHFGSRFVRCSIERLRGAGLVRPAGRAWFPCAFERAFAATKIIAVEAKIGKWAAVLKQARLNAWFASKSYVLVPRVSEEQVRAAQRFGIGVLCPEEDGIREWGASTLPLPRSYASWVMNDLAWRTSKDLSNR